MGEGEALAQGPIEHCFWTRLRVGGRARLVFVPQCHGAVLDGPEHCTCEGLQRQVERLEGELHRERHRAKAAEDAMLAERRRRNAERAQLQRWKDQILGRLKR